MNKYNTKLPVPGFILYGFNPKKLNALGNDLKL